jgi:ferredoxin
MAVTRRDFLKGGVAVGAAMLLGGAIKAGTKKTVKPSVIPGAGEKGHFSAETLAKIDTETFLAACSRCGVCLSECPFKAIRFTGWQLPLLTPETQHKCPGFDVCGVCLAVCPPSALSQAFKPLEEEGLRSGFAKDPWWEGKRINTDVLKKPTPKGGT